MERLSTGIEGLDRLIGGYPREKAVLITGGAGTGKTILALHFVNASCQNGLKCTYLATEEKPLDLIHQATCFGWDFSMYEKSGLLTMVNVLEKRVIEAKEAAKYGTKLETISFMPFYNRIPAESDVVIIDNLGTLAIGMGPDMLRQQMDLLTYKLGEIGATSLIVCDEALGQMTNDILMYSVYGAIKLMRRENPFTNKRERVMDIIKLRATKIPLDYVKFDIDASGIIVLSKE